MQEECAEVERVLISVRKSLRPEALAVIDTKGVWEQKTPGYWAVSCIENAECVFVIFSGSVAKCAIQKAYNEGRVDFEKPISCHLFPIRIENCGTTDTLNYERISLCDPARKQGNHMQKQMIDFLEYPLIRKYGHAWYKKFNDVCLQRRELLGCISGS